VSEFDDRRRALRDEQQSAMEADTIPIRIPSMVHYQSEPAPNGQAGLGNWPPPPAPPGAAARAPRPAPFGTGGQAGTNWPAFPAEPPPAMRPARRHVEPSQPPVATPFTNAVPNADQQQPGVEPQLPSYHELGLIRRARPLPQGGWRKAVHKVTGINPGESEKETRRGALVARVNQPVRGDYSIAVLSQKGGVGKTTATVGLGATFAATRGDRVIAVDANPDFGTLAQRGPDQSRSTVRDLLLDDNIYRYSDIRRHTSQSSSRLEILASERDPATSEAFSEADYRGVIRLLQRFYNIILTDCGTGLVHSVMKGVLDEADSIILVASPAIDAARSALATLDWLEYHGYSHLVPNATVVVSAARPGAMSIDIDILAKVFLTRVRALHVIPFDDHLAQGSEIILDLMSRKTRQTFLELAATVADGFVSSRRSERIAPI
jgi:MinD-like ATPase involved in chromosome partitioning or flagellar assembly